MPVKSNLLRIANQAPKALSEAIDETANFILALIRIHVPVRTGALKASFEIEKLSPLHLLIGSMLNYSVFVNFGTSKQAANPFFTAAFHQAEEFFQRAIINKLKAIS